MKLWLVFVWAIAGFFLGGFYQTLCGSPPPVGAVFILLIPPALAGVVLVVFGDKFLWGDTGGTWTTAGRTRRLSWRSAYVISWFLAPVVLNLLSRMCVALGQEEVASWLFGFRYWSLLVFVPLPIYRWVRLVGDMFGTREGFVADRP